MTVTVTIEGLTAKRAKQLVEDLKNDPLWKEIGAEILLERHVRAAAQPKKRPARKISPSIPTT